MKKRLKSVLQVILSVLFVACVTCRYVEAADSAKTKAKKMYYGVLNSEEFELKGHDICYFFESDEVKFKVVDLNKDGVPEMLLEGWICYGGIMNKEYTHLILSYKNNKLYGTFCDDQFVSVYCKKSQPVVVGCYQGDYYYYTYSGNKLTARLAKYPDYNYYEKNPNSNKTAISKATFNSEFQKLIKGGSKVAIENKTYKNTAANRKKYVYKYTVNTKNAFYDYAPFTGTAKIKNKTLYLTGKCRISKNGSDSDKNLYLTLSSKKRSFKLASNCKIYDSDEDTTYRISIRDANDIMPGSMPEFTVKNGKVTMIHLCP